MPQKTEQDLEKGKLNENDNAIAGGDDREVDVEPLNREKLRKSKKS